MKAVTKMKVGELVNYYVVLDKNGNFYAKTYSGYDAKVIANAEEMLELLKLARNTLADVGQQDTPNYPLFQRIAAMLSELSTARQGGVVATMTGGMS